jgi:hypothetical protein
MLLSIVIRNVAVAGSCLFAAAASGAMTDSTSLRLPFSFVENRGQADARVRYIGTGSEFKAWFEDRSVALQQGRTMVRISFQSRGASTGAKPKVVAEDPVGAKANYLRGGSPDFRQTDLPLFRTVRYEGVWPGVQLDYKA